MLSWWGEVGKQPPIRMLRTSYQTGFEMWPVPHEELSFIFIWGGDEELQDQSGDP